MGCARILNELMLIGSWCLQFYRYHFENPERFPASRTLDVDILVPHANKIRTEADIPEILKREGFTPTFNRANGIVKYNHRELQVEFLVPELGKGNDKPREIKKLHIKAVALRYLNLLLDYQLIVKYEGLEVRVPEPAAFGLHKLIISQRRTNKEKQKADLRMAIGVLDFLGSKPNEVTRMKSILDSLPKKWQRTVRATYEKYYPVFGQRFLPKEYPQIYVACPICGQPMVYLGGLDYHCKKCQGAIGRVGR